MTEKVQPDWEGFGRAVMGCWPGGDIDGGHLQDLAEQYGLIVKAPGGFDPEKHYDETCSADPGDTWFKTTFFIV